jgi:hypothetical protein
MRRFDMRLRGRRLRTLDGVSLRLFYPRLFIYTRLGLLDSASLGARSRSFERLSLRGTLEFLGSGSRTRLLHRTRLLQRTRLG